MHKYERIKYDILNEIKNGEFAPGDKIYSENELKKIYKVSTTTVVKALNDLVNDGILIRRQGEGTFVRKNVSQKKSLFTEKLNLSAFPKRTAEETITRITTPSNKEQKYLENLLNSKEENFHKIVHLGKIENIIWKIQERFIPAELLTEQSLKDISEGASVSKKLGLNKHLINFPMKVEIYSETLDEKSIPYHLFPKQAEFLNPLINQSVFRVNRIIYQPSSLDETNKKVIEVENTYFHSDYYSFLIEIS